MNKKEFYTYLNQPQLIDKHAEIALQEVVTDFPYFHAAQQLLLKAHQNNGSYHFERQLPITSLLHGNRALLYAYLKDSLIKEFQEVAQADLGVTEEAINEVIGADAVQLDLNASELYVNRISLDNEAVIDLIIGDDDEEKFFELKIPQEEKQVDFSEEAEIITAPEIENQRAIHPNQPIAFW